MHLLPHPDLDLMRIGHCYLCGSRPDFTQELRRNRQHPKASLLHIFINKVLRHINPFLEDKYKHRRRIPESEKVIVSQRFSERFSNYRFAGRDDARVVNGLRCWWKGCPAVQKRRQQIVAKLREEGVSDEIELNNRSSSYDFHEDRDVFLSAWVIHCVATVTFRTARRFPSRNGMCPTFWPFPSCPHVSNAAVSSQFFVGHQLAELTCCVLMRWERIAAAFSTPLGIRADIHIAISTRQTIDTMWCEDQGRCTLRGLRRSMPNAERFANCFCRLPSTSLTPSPLTLHSFVHPVSLSCDLPPKQMTARYLTVAKNERGKEWLKPFGEENTTERGKSIRPQRMCIPSKPSGCNGESQTPQKSADHSPHLEDTTTAAMGGVPVQCRYRPVQRNRSGDSEKQEYSAAEQRTAEQTSIRPPHHHSTSQLTR
ncbi:hypothetical protein BLNAU_21200 [Blattamonas nauphoetae]|uniref:Uncharacterized protein n=1 Tax=Blattamonas nauphoetae TaxID=2049346 RepID=A0ABQ9WWM9_9EUKA|nr:hypothetical protein BLNAU_21200 [Blattamonas nauphoetae]